MVKPLSTHSDHLVCHPSDRKPTRSVSEAIAQWGINLRLIAEDAR